MTYLDIARSARCATKDTKETKKVRTRGGNEPTPGYEKNEFDEESPELVSGAGQDQAAMSIAQNLATLTAEEIDAYRRELAEAPDDDPHIAADREALALFDGMHDFSGTVPGEPGNDRWTA